MTGPHMVALSPTWFLASCQAIAFEGASCSTGVGGALPQATTETLSTMTSAATAIGYHLHLLRTYNFLCPLQMR